MRFITGTACGLLALALGAPAAVAAPLPDIVAPQAGPVLRVADATVIWVQRYLLERGYYNGAVDGVSGPRTEAGVRAYEAAAGWPITGDPYVLASRLNYQPPVVAPAPHPVPPPIVPGRPGPWRHRP